MYNGGEKERKKMFDELAQSDIFFSIRLRSKHTENPQDLRLLRRSCIFYLSLSCASSSSARPFRIASIASAISVSASVFSALRNAME